MAEESECTSIFSADDHSGYQETNDSVTTFHKMYFFDQELYQYQ
jgi:hypothetical protein